MEKNNRCVTSFLYKTILLEISIINDGVGGAYVNVLKINDDY